MLRKILPYIAFLLFRCWVYTWRRKIIEHPGMTSALKKKKPLVLAFWHGDEMAVLSACDTYKTATMASTSKDGEMMNTILHLLGVETSRGSSTRGGASALKGMIRLCRTGERLPAIAVDGPKGPYHKPKPGVFELSRLLGAEIVPCGVASSSAFALHKSWNKARLPKPFSKVLIYWGEPITPVTSDQDARDPALAIALEKALDAAGQEAAKLIAKV